MTSQDVLVLITKTCECINLYGKSHIKYVIKLRILNHKSLCKREERMSERRCDNGSRGHGEAIAICHQRARRRQWQPLQYPCLENPMDGGAWWAAVHGVSKSQTRLSDFTVAFHFHALEKEMATHSSVLAWRIPGTGEPGGLPSLGLHRVRHDWSNLAEAAMFPLAFLLLDS